MCCVYRIWCLILLVALTSLCLPALPSAVWKLNFDDQSLGNGPASYYAGSSNEIVPVSLARMDGNGIPQIQTSTGPQGGRMLALTPSTLSTWASQSGYYANGSAGNIGGDGSFTVESLVKLTAYPVSPNNVMQLASNDLMGDGVQMTVDLSIRYNGQVNAFYRIPGMATNPNLNTLGVYALPLNTWTHLACVYIPDPTPGETISTSKGWVGLYVNGVLMLDSSFEGPVGVTTLPLNRWGFGMWGKSTVDANRTINGYLDGIAVSNTALSPAAFVLQQFPASTVWKLTFDNHPTGNGPAAYYASSANEAVPISLARLDGNGIPQVQTSTGPQGGGMLALTPSTLSTWASQSGYYVNGPAGNIGGNGSFTVESLVKLTAYPVSPNNVMQLASNDLMGDNGQMTVDLSIRYNGQVNAFYRIPGMATNPNLNTLGVYALPLNTWTHLACVYIPDPTPGETTSTSKGWVGLYVNGVLTLDSSFEGPVGSVTTLPLNRWGFGMWGKSTTDANRTINGYLDGVAVSNSALSPSRFVLQQFTPNIANFPVQQKNYTIALGGNVRGFGMLAQFAAPGAKEIYVSRTTTVPTNPPDAFPPVALARVFDPNGDLVALYDFSDQPTGTTTTTLPVPAFATTGIWRVSFSGGRKNDTLEIRLPQTDIWGVRGEMPLGISDTLPSDMYVYLPRTVTKIYCETFGGQTPDIELYDQNNVSLGKPTYNASSGRNLLTLTTLTPGTVYRLRQGVIDNAGYGMAFDGVPGLLCPSVAAANALQGGAIDNCDGLLVAGPLQRRARAWMYARRNDNFSFSFAQQSSQSAVDNVQLEVLPYGKYGALPSLESALGAQNLTASSPFFGAINVPATPTDWQSFLHGAQLSLFDASGLLGLYVTPGTWNFGYQNDALRKRAMLSAQYHLVSMQADDLLREGDFTVNSYPLSSVFFVYDAELAKPYLLLKTYYQTHTADSTWTTVEPIWRQGLLAVGDKLGDYTSYESNQWMHVLMGHLETYLATGEPRFRTYFERQLTAFLDGAYGTAAKFGQHPDGYYLEEYGPDGNYQALSEYPLATMYRLYAGVTTPSQALLTKMQAGINKSLAFQQYFWMPQPDYSIYCPTAMNCRTTGLLCNPGYPGVWMEHPDFPLARKRFNLLHDPGTGSGDAGTFSHLANTDAWALRLLNASITAPNPDNVFPTTLNVQGTWLDDIRRSYLLPHTTDDPAALPTLPTEATTGTWSSLSSLTAWKRPGGLGLYGLVFHDVNGASSTYAGIMPKGMYGGGPSAFWSAGTGTVVCSMRKYAAGSYTISSAADLAHSCVYGNNNGGSFYYTGLGTDRSTRTWNEVDHIFTIATTLANPAGTTLTWKYQVENDKTIVTVNMTTNSSTTPPQTAYINLPISLRGTGYTLDTTQADRLTYTRGASHMEIKSLAGNVTLDATPVGTGQSDVKRLILPLPLKNGDSRVREAVFEVCTY